MLFNDITEKIHSNGIDVNSFELLKKHERVVIELKPVVLSKLLWFLISENSFVLPLRTLTPSRFLQIIREVRRNNDVVLEGLINNR